MDLVKKDSPEKIPYYDMNGDLIEIDNPEYMTPEEKEKCTSEWDRLRAKNSHFDYQIKWAEDLCLYSQIDYNIPFDATMYDKMQEYLSAFGANFQLIIIDSKDINKPLFIGEESPDKTPKRIYIEFIRPKKDKPGHYNYITNIREYSEKPFYCYQCYIAHHNPQHRCENSCPQCGVRPKCDMTDPIDCIVCMRRFNNKVDIQ